jgi:energy-coupling factor transporter transmembrane protein EcfT
MASLIFIQPLFWISVFVATVLLILLGVKLKMRWLPAIISRFLLIFICLILIFPYRDSRATKIHQPGFEALIVDQSGSISREERERLQEIADEWSMLQSNRIVVGFGTDAKIIGQKPWPAFDIRSSNLLPALKLVQKLAGKSRGKISIITDGNITQSEAVENEIAFLVNQGYTIDIISLQNQHKVVDFSLGEILTPTIVWANTQFKVYVPVNNPDDKDIKNLSLYVDGNIIRPDPDRPASDLFSFTVSSKRPGVMTMEASIDILEDENLENNRTFAVVNVFEAPNILFPNAGIQIRGYVSK